MRQTDIDEMAGHRDCFEKAVRMMDNGEIYPLQPTMKLYVSARQACGLSAQEYDQSKQDYVGDGMTPRRGHGHNGKPTARTVRLVVDFCQKRLYGWSGVTATNLTLLSENDQKYFLKFAKVVGLCPDGPNISEKGLWEFLKACKKLQPRRVDLDKMTPLELMMAVARWSTVSDWMGITDCIALTHLTRENVSGTNANKNAYLKFLYNLNSAVSTLIQSHVLDAYKGDRLEWSTPIEAARHMEAIAGLSTEIGGRVIMLIPHVGGCFEAALDAAKRGLFDPMREIPEHKTPRGGRWGRTGFTIECKDGIIRRWYVVNERIAFIVSEIGEIAVPDILLKKPERQLMADIEMEQNLEVKRLRIERCAGLDQPMSAGWLKYLAAINSKIVDQRQNDVEMTKEVLLDYGNMRDRLLICTCKTGRVFVLQVPVATKTCQEASMALAGEDLSRRAGPLDNIEMPKMNIIGRS